MLVIISILPNMILNEEEIQQLALDIPRVRSWERIFREKERILKLAKGDGRSVSQQQRQANIFGIECLNFSNKTKIRFGAYKCIDFFSSDSRRRVALCRNKILYFYFYFLLHKHRHCVCICEMGKILLVFIHYLMLRLSDYLAQ
jgi:hypothetical protein